jgi:short-subunit dehydrogenase
MARRQLNGKRIVLTGASSGIGRCLAKRLIDAGARLLVCGRRSDRLESVRKECDVGPDRCLILAGDVTVALFQEQIMTACRENWDGLDCLINNAGITALGRFDTASEERLRRVFEVNFFALTSLIRRSLPMLTEGDDGLIVNIGSVLGHRAVPLKSEYCASKFAVRAISDAIRAELAGSRVDVLLVSPSTVKSDLFESAIDNSTGRSWQPRWAMDPDYVARKTVQAMHRRRNEIILPASGKMLVWFDRLMPWVANRLVTRFGQ